MMKNMTVGRPWQLIASFSLPLIIGNMFQQFYNMADSFIVGRTIGTEALAAVGCTGSINFMVLGFMIGFTQGASIITSQRFGAGDEAGVRRSFACGIVLSVFITAILMIFSFFFLKGIMRLLNTPENIFDDAWSYIAAIIFGMPALTIFNICSSMMRAVGDSKTPLYFLIIACVINVILDYVFILCFGMGVFGAGIATVIAQLASGLMCIPTINKKIPALRIRREDWKISGKDVLEQMRVAVPVAFQWSIIAIGALAVTFAINGLGAVSIAAFSTGNRIDQLAGMPLSSIGAALTTYSAQNYGAKKFDRIRKGVFQGAVMAFAFAVLMGVFFIVFGRFLGSIFMKDEIAVNLTYKYLVIQGVFFVLLSQLFIYRQTLQGLGNSLIPTVSGVMELIMRSVAALALSAPFGFTGVCYASPLAWAGALIPLTAALAVTLKRLKRAELAMAKV